MTRQRASPVALNHAHPTLKQVAEATGVHYSTVSRALNPRTRGLVADAVATRVLAVAERLGYRPDPAAASLRTGRSGLIGTLVPGIANPVFAPILAGAEAVLATRGYALLVADPDDDPARQMELADSMVARRVDGLLIATAVAQDDPVIARCLARGVPAVLINRGEVGLPRVPTVVPDDVLGMRLAVRHLMGLGHARIGHLAGPAGFSTGLLRRRGFEAAMVDGGLDPQAVEVAGSYGRAPGRAAAERLLARHPELTAVACANDLLALGAYDALAALGRSCPEDVSIVGHNDMPLMDMIAPPLTTIRIAHAEMGREAALLLLRAIEGREAGNVLLPASVLLPSELVIRGSAAPPGVCGPASPARWRASCRDVLAGRN